MSRTFILVRHSERLEYPHAVGSYPYNDVIPEFFDALRTASMRTTRVELLPAAVDQTFVREWPRETRDQFASYVHAWTRFVVALYAYPPPGPYRQRAPANFTWHSAFSDDEYSDTCVLFETVMLWHMRALLSYHSALDIETTDRASARTYMKQAATIWRVVSPRFLRAWELRNELYLPFECTEIGIAFFLRVTDLKLAFYDLCDGCNHASSWQSILDYCFALAHASSEVSHVIRLARVANGAHSAAHLVDFEVYEALAMMVATVTYFNQLRKKVPLNEYRMLCARLFHTTERRVEMHRAIDWNLLSRLRLRTDRGAAVLAREFFCEWVERFGESRTFLQCYLRETTASSTEKRPSLSARFWRIILARTVPSPLLPVHPVEQVKLFLKYIR